MDGETDSSGSIVFTVIQSIGYKARVTHPTTGVVYTSYLYPGSDPFIIWIGNNPIKNATANPPRSESLNQTKLYLTQSDPGNVTNNLDYRDMSGRTTSVTFIVKYANNLTVAYQETKAVSGTTAVHMNWTHVNIRGQGYFFGYNATRT
jgi:hypothetical protein